MAVATASISNDISEDQEDLQLHPLQDRWAYYLLCHEHSTKPWDEQIRNIATFSTVEHFWSVYLHTADPGKISNGNDLYVFKEGIRPQWEDPKNEHGGRWLINIPQGGPIDRYWEELLVLLVSCYWDTNEESEQICGAAFQSRSRGHKLAVWLTNASDKESILSIGKRIKERLRIPEKIYFQSVSDQKSATRGRDVTVGRYEL